MAQGVDDRRVIQDLRSTIRNTVHKEHILASKDIANIRASFGIAPKDPAGIQVHKDDAVSISAWIESERLLGEANSVLYYKWQEDVEPGCHNADAGEFMLVIMNPFQKEMAKRYGSRVCIDSTHGTTSYDFELTTLMLIDEYEEGFPAAFLISNTVNTKILTKFLESVKDAVGVIQPTHFMNDDAPMMFNAWVAVMGGDPQKLLCAWHVDRAWQGHLNCIKNEEKRRQIYKSLKVCLYELRDVEFRKMLDELLEECAQDVDDDVQKFRTYFIANYVDRAMCWAYCYRVGAKINTNMHVENFHVQLKHVYMHGKKSKRLDKLVYSLKEYLNNKLFDRIRTLHKGKVPRKMRHVLRNHERGSLLAPGCIMLEATQWSCPSQSMDDKVYIVKKAPHECMGTTCIVKCSLCHVCYNEFTCECLENAIRSNLCKHIHAVGIFCQGLTGSVPNHSHQVTADVVEEITVYTGLVSSCEESLDNFQKTRELLTSCMGLMEGKSCNKSIADQINSHLESVKKLMLLNNNAGAMKSETALATSTSNEPANKKSEHQRRFFSTKRKRQTASEKRCHNPDESERRNLNKIHQNEEYLISTAVSDHVYE